MATIIYHHRTRANGAEGVHIRGIQNGFRELGYEITDMSLFRIDSESPAPGDTARPGGFKKALLNAVASYLPNVLFKLLEVLYNCRTFLAGRRVLSACIAKKTLPELIYERYAYFSFAMAFLAQKFHVPFVLEVNTTCLDYDVREIRLRWLARKIERYVFDKATLLVVVSTYLKEKIRQEYQIPEHRIIVTPNAVDPRRFASVAPPELDQRFDQARRFAQGKIVIGFVGMFVPWHGLDFLLDIFLRLIREAPLNVRLGLLLVGDGPVRRIIEEKITANALTDAVFITGAVPHDEIKAYLDLFNIAIMPDSNPFGSPMKIFEYMTMGKPVVAPAYGPILEIITQGETGLVFTPKDHTACLNAILELIENAGLRNRLGEKARTLVLTEHTWQRNVERIIERLQSCQTTM
ncbi:MAG: glycosyltransferase family 4 protein [Lentisphaerae bacterium]|nr:glycosyltransferase family 4 protein [Lentisphaerota bacterium]